MPSQWSFALLPPTLRQVVGLIEAPPIGRRDAAAAMGDRPLCFGTVLRRADAERRGAGPIWDGSKIELHKIKAISRRCDLPGFGKDVP